MKKIILLVFMCFVCTGCFDYQELGELGIISAMSIVKNEDNFRVDIQLINIIESGDHGVVESPVTVVSGEGPTVFDAVRSMNLRISKSFFPANMAYLIVDKSVLEENDLREVMDFFARHTKLSLNFLVITTTDSDPSDVMASLSEFNINAATNMAEVIRLSEKRYGASYSLTFLEYLKDYFEPGITPVYPNIYMHGDAEISEDIDDLKKTETESYIELKDLVTFDKQGNAIHLGVDESMGYNFLKNHVTNATVTSTCGDEYFTVETLSSKFKFEDDLKNNKIKVIADIDGEISFYGCKEDLNESKVLKDVTTSFENKVKENVLSTLNLAKQSQVDFVGVGNFIYKNNTKYFDFDKNDWDKEGLSKIDFDIEINANLYKQGNLKGDI